MKATIEPGKLSGTLSAPSSKSMTQRAYAAALLHKGKTILYNTGASADEMAAFNIIHSLGAYLSPGRGILHGIDVPRLIVESNGLRQPVSTFLVCNESGLSARLFTCIAALLPYKMTMYGAESMLKRPLAGLESAFQQLGVQLFDFKGYVPFSFQGPIIPSDVAINAEDSSQLLSGLLFALSSSADKPVTITATSLKSKPYIDLTLDILAHFGKPVLHSGYREFYVDPAQFTHSDTVELHIEGDWSSAAFFLAAGAIAGEITVKNLNMESKQADKAILTLLKKAGAAVSAYGDAVTVQQAPLSAFEFDATDSPDLFPVLSILAACCNGESYIAGVHRLFHKESNRAESISEMLSNFDVPFSIEDDTLCITGVKKMQGTVIDSYNDHRIAMAAAVGALKAGGPVDILRAESVHKSYPAFFKVFSDCGGRCILA